jgi:hypothetical protein
MSPFLISLNSYGEIASPFLLLSLYSYGNIVSPFLIESAVFDYLPEDSSFTEGSVNVELLLVIFPVLFICFQTSLHDVHHLNCLYIYFFHYLFSESGLSWFLSRRFGGSLFLQTIISELLGCLFA